MQSAAAQLICRIRAVVRAAGAPPPRPPFRPERYAAACGVVAIRRSVLDGGGVTLAQAGPAPRSAAIPFSRGAKRSAPARPRWILTLDSRLPPRTPQWNGVVAAALARTLLPPGLPDATADALAEIGAAELVLPMRAFRPAASRTDLTMDGLRDLAVAFAAPIRLTVRQWLRTGLWRGYALLWRDDGGTPVLRWRAASADARFPDAAALGAPAGALFGADSRLHATFRTGRPHHGVEPVRGGPSAAWWFVRFGRVRDGLRGASDPAGGGRAVLALVVLDRRKGKFSRPSK